MGGRERGGDGREQAVVNAGADKPRLAGTLEHNRCVKTMNVFELLTGDALCRGDRALTAVAVEGVSKSRMF